MNFGYMYLDMSYIWLIIVPAILVSIVTGKFYSTLNKYKKLPSYNGVTGAQLARRVLDGQGLQNVRVVEGRQNQDHYDPRSKTVSLSPDIYRGSSVASLGVAAHEVGHALQFQAGYFPIHIRNFVLPICQLGSGISPLLILVGIIMGSSTFLYLGIIFFATVVVFQFVTLPVEFNASTRAIQILSSGNFLVGEELKGASKVLKAAAMTYVAALLTSFLQLVRLLLIAQRRNDR